MRWGSQCTRTARPTAFNKSQVAPRVCAGRSVPPKEFLGRVPGFSEIVVRMCLMLLPVVTVILSVEHLVSASRFQRRAETAYVDTCARRSETLCREP